jgi:hypothetical protein
MEKLKCSEYLFLQLLSKYAIIKEESGKTLFVFVTIPNDPKL